jgi:hypothetical protein
MAARMFLGRLIEPALRRLWGRRWDAVARAESRVGLSPGSAGTVLFLALAAWGGAVWALLGAEDFRTAAAVARGIASAGWFLAMAMNGSHLQGMFVLDSRLGVTEAWLLTSAPREDVLWSRLAGRSMSGPLMVLLMAPVYVLGAMGLDGRQYPLYVLGHVARMVSVQPLPGGGGLPALLAALPVGLAAAASDALLLGMLASGSLCTALLDVSRRRFWSDLRRSFVQGTGLHFRLLAVTLLALLAEAALGALAGLWLWLGDELTAPARVLAGLPLAAAVGAAAGLTRTWLMRRQVEIAASHYDAIMLEDEP